METKRLEEKSAEQSVFVCKQCKFVVNYDYFGRTPPFSKNFVLMEEAYIMRDPFSAEGGMITLGSNCSLCTSPVCISQTCSIFYTRRFCMPCVKKNIHEFPSEIKEEISKKRSKD